MQAAVSYRDLAWWREAQANPPVDRRFHHPRRFWPRRWETWLENFHDWAVQAHAAKEVLEKRWPELQGEDWERLLPTWRDLAADRELWRTLSDLYVDSALRVPTVLAPRAYRAADEAMFHE